MKTLTIGDIHGRRTWVKFLFGSEDLFREWKRASDLGRTDMLKSIVPMYDYDKIIFVGDYVDSFDVSNVEMKDNLQDIIFVARVERDRLVLLLGNHDVQYFLPKAGGCSGFRPEMKWDFQELFQRDRELFQLAYQWKDWLWTHAGINERFFSDHMENRPRHQTEDWAYMLNDMLMREESQIFQVSLLRGGASLYAGPLWTDRRELMKDPMPGINQIVGHTQVNEIETVEGPNSTLVFVDTLGFSGKPFVKTFVNY
jgi:hypothetical protein